VAGAVFELPAAQSFGVADVVRELQRGTASAAAEAEGEGDDDDDDAPPALSGASFSVVAPAGSPSELSRGRGRPAEGAAAEPERGGGPWPAWRAALLGRGALPLLVGVALAAVGVAALARARPRQPL